MPSLYTSPNGSTAQGQQLSSFQNMLGSITGQITPQTVDNMSNASAAVTASMPAFTANQTAANYNTAGLPQAATQQSDDAKMYQMFLADNNLSQKYTNPNDPNANPDFDFAKYGITTGAPMMTNAGLSGGFQGFSNPIYAQQSADLQLKGIGDAINAIQSFIGYNKGAADSQTAMDKQQRLAVADLLASMAKTGQARLDSSAKSALDPVAIMQQAQADAARGMKLKDLLDKYAAYGGQVDPNAIYAAYNRYNYTDTNGKKVGYGDVLESPETLFGWGVSQAKPTATYLKQQQQDKQEVEGAKKVLDSTDKIFADWKSMNPVERAMGALSQTSGISGLSPKQTAIDAEFFANLEEGIRKSVVGGRITQQEIQWIRQKLLPNPYDSDASAQAKINALQEGARRKLTEKGFNFTSIPDPLSSSGKSTQQSSGGTVVMTGPGGTFNVPKDKVSLFKQNGYK